MWREERADELEEHVFSGLGATYGTILTSGEGCCCVVCMHKMQRWLTLTPPPFTTDFSSAVEQTHMSTSLCEN